MTAPLDDAEDRAAAAGRVFARTCGMDVRDGSTQYRMRRARIGARVVDVYGPDGELAGQIAENGPHWAGAVQLEDASAPPLVAATFAEAAAQLLARHAACLATARESDTT